MPGNINRRRHSGLDFFVTNEYCQMLRDFLEHYTDFLKKLGAKTYLMDLGSIDSTDRSLSRMTIEEISKTVTDAKRRCERDFEAILKWQNDFGYPIQEMDFQKASILLLNEERLDVYNSLTTTISFKHLYQNFDDFENFYQEVLTRRFTGQHWAP